LRPPDQPDALMKLSHALGMTHTALPHRTAQGLQTRIVPPPTDLLDRDAERKRPERKLCAQQQIVQIDPTRSSQLYQPGIPPRLNPQQLNDLTQPSRGILLATPPMSRQCQQNRYTQFHRAKIIVGQVGEQTRWACDIGVRIGYNSSAHPHLL
jgi:hypothetical protein